MLTTLQANQVAFNYPQNNCGLEPVTLTLKKNQGLFISGDSGSGKSTLTRCLSGLIPHLYRGEFYGEILIDKTSTRDLSMWEIANKVGLVFQNPAHQILAPTVESEILFGLENLGLSRSDMKFRLENTLTQFELIQFRNRSPHTLSGGEQQKLALASITARQPQTYIFDEPLSMLDTTSAVEFVKLLEKLITQGNAAIICEHREKYLQQSKNISKFLLHGKHRNIIHIPEKYQTYPSTNDPFLLQVSNLSVEKSGKKIIQNINFELQAGQIVAIVGRNGAGKTTLLRSLAGLQKFSGKTVIHDGKCNQKPLFNMVFQNPDIQLFNPSVKEEILYHIENPDFDRYRWLMDMLDLQRYEDTPPLLLSEGEKRRVALATALMRYSSHGILLDEPALGQDESHKQILVRLMKKLADAGFLIIYTTHDLELAAHADQLILLNKNGIVSQGKTSDVINLEAAWHKIGLIKPEWMALNV
ncbi:MAG: hypothetical protein CL609_24890 [Anaerolineaceae bacterium]|nr:hypothetical protein [Anaerolineaceae bacterium]